MKQKTILKSLLPALAFCLLLGVSALAAEKEPGLEGYNDIEDTTYESDIAVMQTMGLTLGYADGSYRPGRAYTRLELAQLTQGLLGADVPEDFEIPYADAQNIAGSDAVAVALYQNILSGRTADSFDPYGSVLKAELMAALADIAAALGTDELVSKLDESLALWAEDFSLVTAGEAMHAARAMIGALEPQQTEEAPAPEGEASGEPSAEPSAEPAADESLTETDIAADEPAEDAEDLPTTESNEDAEATATDAAEADETAETEDAAETDGEEAPAPETEASGEPSADPSAEPAADASAEPPAEMTAPAEPAPTAPQGVLAPGAAQTPAAPAEPATPPIETPAPDAPTAPAPTTEGNEPTISPDDPFGDFKAEVYAFYADLRDRMAAFMSDLLS